ncbi:hypothetical protein HY440_01585 [Candidatus Microgenomates bacterium]|nr:hypothetical protein [Candidatus Microgenomates bacterium]
MEEIKTPSTEPVVKPLKGVTFPSLKIDWTKKTIIILVVLVVLGVISGFGLYAWQTKGTTRIAGKDVEVVSLAGEEGVKDASTFKDTATGTLQVNDGKITKEGTHILVRGDASQNVYMTSSVIDLDKYVSKKVQVWGQTFQAQTAGWLMDVGRIKIVN